MEETLQQQREQGMNRLVIIGNGFDLYHGLKTTYKNFMEWYLLEYIPNNLNQENSYEDNLLGLSISINEFPVRIGDYLLANQKPYQTNVVPKIRRFIGKYFMKELLNAYSNSKTATWADLEAFYFECLKKIVNQPKQVEELNTQFEQLKTHLEEYLKREFNTFKNRINSMPSMTMAIENIIIEDEIDLSEIVLPNKAIKAKPNKIHILNFNYTATIQHVCDIKEAEINYIHGSIGGRDEKSIIFGFGDEHNADYKSYEDAHENTNLYKHVKSFQYFQNDAYHKLVQFINSEEYQVYILGHSCGLSDRTLLKEIFEHEHCKSIKIYPHTKTDFKNKTYNISRLFTDKALMRKKIVPLTKSLTMDRKNVPE